MRSVWTRDYDGDDLSFAQRVYESEQVYDKIDDSASTALVGRGLGATVDLSASPDRRTLRAAGRDLPEVNDVHLLPYEILLKRGVLGLVVLLLYGIVLALVLQRAVESRKPAAVFFAAIPAMGLFDALSAGSHFFANPVAPYRSESPARSSASEGRRPRREARGRSAPGRGRDGRRRLR